MADVTFGPCCFCGKAISTQGVDPCALTIETAQAKVQTWYCHAACFRIRLAPEESLQPVNF
jgi:hypothetical protein